LSGLFQKASKIPRRLKAYIYGESGSGKTVTALYFPNPVVIDLERGTDHYAEPFNYGFDVLQTTDPLKVREAVDQLVKDPGDYKTLVIDPMTVFYDQVLSYHLKRKKMRTGNPNETLAPLDYKPIQAEMDDFINKLICLDMNIILTAHSAVQYSNEPGEFMKPIGTKPDGYKKLPFMMDVLIELEIQGDKRFAIVRKDRTNKLPKRFEFTYQEMAKYIGIAELERDPVAIFATQQLEKINERNVEISIGGKKYKSAGITADTVIAVQDLLKRAGTTAKEFSEKLTNDFGVTDILDLREDDGNALLKDLQTSNI